YINNKYISTPPTYMACNKCEFKTNEEDKSKGLKSGFEECFEKQLQWNEKDFKKTNLFDIRGIHWTKSIKLFQNKLIFAENLTQEEIGFKEGDVKLSDTERAWIQIEKARDNDLSIFVDIDGLKEEINDWVFPLHFIDFETCTAALPFSKGRRPYEQ